MTLREWRGTMPQTKLARILGVSRRTWQRWERGQQAPPQILLHLIRLSIALEDLVARCDGEDGVGSNINTLAAHAALGHFWED